MVALGRMALGLLEDGMMVLGKMALGKVDNSDVEFGMMALGKMEFGMVQRNGKTELGLMGKLKE